MENGNNKCAQSSPLLQSTKLQPLSGTPCASKVTLGELVLLGSFDELFKRLAKATSEDVNKADERGQTILHYAIESGHEDLVLKLVCHRAIKASIRDQRKRSPLHLAVRSEKLCLVELVLRVTSNVDIFGPNDRTPLHVASLLSLPAIAQLLIDKGANPMIKDKEEMTPIGLAARKGCVPILDMIFSRYKTNDRELLQSTCGPDQSSLLHLAVESCSAHTVVYLLHKGVNTRSIDARGFTALHVACRVGNLPILRHLVNSEPWLLEASSSDRITPLHEAAKYDQVVAVEFLLSNKASLDAVTYSGAPPLLFAASFGSFKTMQQFLSRDVNFLAKDEDGVNVLHCAVGHSKTVRLLTETLGNHPNFEELISASDSNGATALHYACQYGNFSDVTTFLEHGAKVDAVNRDGTTALHFAAKRGHLGIISKLCSYAPRLLIAVDACGRTPLHIASLYGNSKVLANLVSHGAVIMSDREGRTPFHCAAWKGSVECMKFLLSEFSREFNSVDCEKSTPLHLAVVANFAEIVSFLLDHGAVITNNDAGQNCLDIAIAKDFEECVSVCVSHERWKEFMKPLAKSKKKSVSQLEMLVQKMPEQAEVIMDKCISSEENHQLTQIYDFSYMLGVTDDDPLQQPQALRKLLQTMVNLKRSSCLAHPLCVEFLNTMWRKFLAVVVIANIAIYAIFLLLLMTMAIHFSAYSPDPLEQEDSVKRLIMVVQQAVEHNRTTLSDSEKYEFCFGNAILRAAVVFATTLCLAKECFIMWFKGMQYFYSPSNVCEIVVYGLTFVFLDPYGVLLHDLNIPQDSCPKIVWEIAAVTVFLAWTLLLVNFQRMPHVGIYIVMIISMVKTMIQVVVVVTLFVLAFGLAFYLLMSNKTNFSSSGLSLMRVVTMAVGDLAHDDTLLISPSSESAKLDYYYDRLRDEYGQFDFTNFLPTTTDVNVSAINGTTAASDNDNLESCLVFPFLSYAFFICFAMLMPIVVLNVLIGLAVGDIEAVRADAALRQIRMQIKLLVEVETVLPSWFLRHVHVTTTSRQVMEINRTVNQLLSSAVKAAEEPTGKMMSTTAVQLGKIKQNTKEVKTWLSNIEKSLQQQWGMLRTLAACVKRQNMNQSTSSVVDKAPDESVVRKSPVTVSAKEESLKTAKVESQLIDDKKAEEPEARLVPKHDNDEDMV